MNVFYGEIASWWPLVSPLDEYADEAKVYVDVLARFAPEARTMLELGCGGGHNAFHLKDRYRLTLTDISRAMLDVSEALNPGCEHLPGDMRTMRLCRTFDVVFAHDAVDYMTTESELESAIRTAWAHLEPGGVALFVPDHVEERFEPGTSTGGSDGMDGRSVRFLEWTEAPGAGETVGSAHYAFVLRESDGRTRCLGETHRFGLFPEATWVRLFREVGFDLEVLDEPGVEDRPARRMFVGRRPFGV